MAVAQRDVEAAEAVRTAQTKARIGVLALQGDFEKHAQMLDKIDGANACLVRSSEDMRDCDGLIIPGGESSTVGKLMSRYGVDDAIRQRHADGMAVFGTCTGMILLAKEIEGSDQPSLGLMDITVRRNAFGRQIDSFEVDLEVACIGGATVRAVFIRAPYVTEARGNVQVLAKLDSGEMVMVRQGNCLAAAFHPEVTADTRIHEYFISMARPLVSSPRN